MSQATFNQNCYGCDPEKFVESVESSMTFKFSGPSMVIMSLMSDAQCAMEFGDNEEARKTLNRAKFLVNRYFPVNAGVPE